MRDFVIVVDSACDLPLNIIDKYSMKSVGLKCNFKGNEYIDDFGQSLSYSDFFKGIREGEMPITSQVNSYDFHTLFEDIVKSNKEILYIALSSMLSGTINSARIAKDEILEEYPDADISIVDSKSGSLGEGLLVLKACELKEQGASKLEIIQYLEENSSKVIHAIAMDDLEYLKKGGRISGATAAIGSILNIKPLIKLDSEGKVVSMGKVKGRKKSISALFKELEEKAVDLINQKIVAISHADCIEDAEKLKNMITEKYNIEVLVNYMGCVIGSHSGADALALYFMGNER